MFFYIFAKKHFKNVFYVFQKNTFVSCVQLCGSPTVQPQGRVGFKRGIFCEGYNNDNNHRGLWH